MKFREFRWLIIVDLWRGSAHRNFVLLVSWLRANFQNFAEISEGYIAEDFDATVLQKCYNIEEINCLSSVYYGDKAESLANLNDCKFPKLEKLWISIVSVFDDHLNTQIQIFLLSSNKLAFLWKFFSVFLDSNYNVIDEFICDVKTERPLRFDKVDGLLSSTCHW